MWLTNMKKEIGDDLSDEKVKEFIWNTLNSGVSLLCPLVFLYFFLFFSCRYCSETEGPLAHLICGCASNFYEKCCFLSSLISSNSLPDICLSNETPSYANMAAAN